MRFAFATCVQLGRSVIERIYEMSGKLEFLVTLDDNVAIDKSGRVYLDDIAAKQHTPLIKINSINEDAVIEAIRQYDIDWLFIIGWSQIAKPNLLAAPHKGCIGMHPTLLPQGRGRASIPWAILKNLDQTGVSMFKLEEGVDTGPILGQVLIPLHPAITATELYDLVNDAHISLIERYWKPLECDTLQLITQDESKATEWPGRRPSDGELNPDMTMEEAERMVRAVTHPYPGAFYYNGTTKIIVWKAKTSESPETQFSFKCSDGYLIPIDYSEECHQ